MAVADNVVRLNTGQKAETQPGQAHGVEANEAPAAPSPGEAHDGYRHLDRLIHAGIGTATLGISPASLSQAWQDWALHLAISPGKQLRNASKGVDKATRFGHYLASGAALGPDAEPCITPLPQDHRFTHPGWRDFPFNVAQQSFLLWQQWWHNATTHVPGVSAKHERLVEFYSRQLLDTVSPSNFLMTNPEVLQKTLQTDGTNLAAGWRNFLDDMVRTMDGRGPAGTEDFRPGEAVAVTPGEVVYRNELIELIQYRPTTEKVAAEPVLIVPAWIMKYYILDLSPENSLVRYLVGQGFTVFCVSWRNPGREQRDVELDDYRRLGVMEAFDAVSEISGGEKVHGVGYCLGGTLLSIAASAMARDGDERLKTLSLFAAQVDFDEPGELGLFIDESQLSMLEDLMWEEGYLDQRQMAGAFQMLRSQDLVWSHMVHAYMMGEKEPMSDLMAWNADATRMPYKMHSQYLRKLYLGNDLSQGRFHVDGRPIHVEDIQAPVFAVGTVTDHVAPWRSVFKLMHLLDTDVDFVLTSGGHNAGIVSEPGHKHRSYRRLAYKLGGPHADPDHWMEGAAQVEGSWWPAWAAWLSGHSARQVPARESGSKAHPPICAAPGTYVLEP